MYHNAVCSLASAAGYSLVEERSGVSGCLFVVNGREREGREVVLHGLASHITNDSNPQCSAPHSYLLKESGLTSKQEVDTRPLEHLKSSNHDHKHKRKFKTGRRENHKTCTDTVSENNYLSQFIGSEKAQHWIKPSQTHCRRSQKTLNASCPRFALRQLSRSAT